MFDIDAFTSGLIINSCTKVYCSKDWDWDTSKQGNFTDFDLWTVLNGKGVLTSNGNSYPVCTGNCFFLYPQKHYTAKHDPKNPLTVIYIHFNSLFTANVEQGFTLCRHILHLDRFKYLLEKVILNYTKKNETEALCWLRVALYEVYEHDKIFEQTGLFLAHYQCVNQICMKIQKNPHGTHRLCQYAREYNYSCDYLGRIFKAYLGVPFSTFLVRTRINYANFLLRTTGKSISQIADFLGYSDSSFFTKQYQKYEGVTPSRYRIICRDS
jgi:AraC-like DNA-binding protein